MTPTHTLRRVALAAFLALAFVAMVPTTPAHAFSCMDDCTADPFKTEAQCEEECALIEEGVPEPTEDDTAGKDTSGQDSDDTAQEDTTEEDAAGPESGGDDTPSIDDVLPQVSVIDEGGKVGRGKLNPIVKGYSTLRGAVGSFLAFLLSFVGVVALLILVLQGYKYITGAGGGSDSAKKAIANVVLGIVLIIGAWALVVTVMNLGGGPGM